MAGHMRACFYPYFLFFIQFLVAQNEKLPIPKYSTKTSYDLSFNEDDIFSRNLSWKEFFNEHEFQSCSPIGLYVVYRHGTRYPSEKDMNKFNTFLEKIRANDINPEFKHLQIENKMQLDLQRSLSEIGKAEMNLLAGRLKKRFPELFQGDFHLNDYAFQSTNLSRTIDSTTSFIRGFVSTGTTCSSSPSKDKLTLSCENASSTSKETVVVPLQNKTADYLLRFFDAYEDCLKDQDEEDGDERREDEKFVEGKEVERMKMRLVKKLSVPGASEMLNMTNDEAIGLAKMCGYQLALFKKSNWCSLLNDEDLRVFEYKQDLKHYWKRGYGHPVNYRVGCNLAQDIVNYFNQLTNKQKNTPKGIFKFAHAETVIPLQCLLDLYKEKRPLLATDYQENHLRQFRTSWMAPFAANIAFVLFKCSSEAADDADGYKMQVYLNELPVDLPFCQSTFCDLKDFTLHIEQTIGRCNFNNTCCIENCEGDRLSGWAIFGIVISAVVIISLPIFIYCKTTTFGSKKFV